LTLFVPVVYTLRTVPGCKVCLDLSGFGLRSFLGFYWTTASGIERWNKELFCKQARTMTESTGLLMTADIEAIKPLPPDSASTN